MRILLVNPAYESACEPEALLDRYDTLTGWGEALLGAGASEVVTLQRFSRDLDLVRGGVRYLFRDDGGGEAPRPWTRPRRLLRAAASSRVDLVHANGLVFPTFLAQLRRALPPSWPMVVQHHAGGPPLNRSRGPRNALRRLVWRRGLAGAAAFLFTAAEQAEPWRRAGLLRPEQPVHGIPEASRSVRCVPRTEAQGRSGLRGRPVVLWIGRLVPEKDPASVLEGFAAALASLPEAQLAFVYQHETLLASLRERVARDPNLAERVHFMGAKGRAGLADVLSSSDIFVLGSRDEGSGYALLEALACGLVPVVTDIPAFRALTAGGTLGALWRQGDATALTGALAVVGRRALEPQRDAVRRHFEAELSWPAVGRRALALYRQVIASWR
jgi:glycosyltransferase involved in cell wall biosynthesis